MSELTLEERATNFETMQHIQVVQNYLFKCATLLHQLGFDHDQSKLVPPEVTFTKFTPLLKTVEYGSDEYKSFLTQMAPALENHYANNPHHPEHHEHGIYDMDLLLVLEMLIDWMASSRRTKDGNIYKSLQIQKSRFRIDDQLYAILKNTVRRLHPELENPYDDE
jgi:hypothetical protein